MHVPRTYQQINIFKHEHVYIKLILNLNEVYINYAAILNKNYFWQIYEDQIYIIDIIFIGFYFNRLKLYINVL